MLYSIEIPRLIELQRSPKHARPISSFRLCFKKEPADGTPDSLEGFLYEIENLMKVRQLSTLRYEELHFLDVHNIRSKKYRDVVVDGHEFTVIDD